MKHTVMIVVSQVTIADLPRVLEKIRETGDAEYEPGSTEVTATFEFSPADLWDLKDEFAQLQNELEAMGCDASALEYRPELVDTSGVSAKPLAYALATIAVGGVPLGQFGEMRQAIEQYALHVLECQGVEPDPEEISQWLM